METLIEGPSWGVAGTSGAVVRNPLQVENVIFSVVDRLLPGVISTTPHARYLGLHALVRKESVDRGLSAVEANDLMRRCEAITAAVAVHHEPHLVVLPDAHGESRVKALLQEDGGLDVARVSAPGQYSESMTGFYGTYRGPEVDLGVVAPGATQEAGDRYADGVVRPALGQVLELATLEHIDADQLRAAAHLCPCAANGNEAEWLRTIVGGLVGGDAYAVADEARRDTVRIIARTLGVSGAPVEQLWGEIRRAVSFGAPLDIGPYAGIELAEAWRGLMLRNYSVWAWRHLWAWVVRELTERHSTAAIADALAAELPADWTVADVTATLPAGSDGPTLLPVEPELRVAQPGLHPLTEFQLLAVGVRRLDELTGWSHRVFAGDNLDDLGPVWLQGELEANANRPLREWAAELVEKLLWRSQRIAMLKMDLLDPAAPRLPAQVIERDGIWEKQMNAGDVEPGMRIPSLITMLAGAGVLGADSRGYWLTDEGAQFLA